MKTKAIFSIAVLLLIVRFAPAQNIPEAALAQRGYLLGPGDEITGKVLGEPQFDFVATVNEDGKIEVPFFDKPLVAKCKTERDLRTDVTTLLAKYLRSPQLSLRVTDRKSRPPATISGEVMHAEQVELRRKATLIELISIAGGVKEEEAGGTVQVFRTQPPICAEESENSNWKSTSNDPTDVPSRLYKLADIRLGKEDSNPIIYPGDVIVVAKASPVYITGEVVSPQGIYLKEGGMTLTEAIAKIGGVRREAKTKDIKIYRLKPNSKDRDTISANYDQIKKGLQQDVMLQAYDIVEVDKAKDTIAQSLLKIAIGAGKGVLTSVTGGIGYRVLY
jgi:polysaccharide biosynthesis/export protein